MKSRGEERRGEEETKRRGQARRGQARRGEGVEYTIWWPTRQHHGRESWYPGVHADETRRNRRNAIIYPRRLRRAHGNAHKGSRRPVVSPSPAGSATGPKGQCAKSRRTPAPEAATHPVARHERADTCHAEFGEVGRRPPLLPWAEWESEGAHVAAPVPHGRGDADRHAPWGPPAVCTSAAPPLCAEHAGLPRHRLRRPRNNPPPLPRADLKTAVERSSSDICRHGTRSRREFSNTVPASHP